MRRWSHLPKYILGSWGCLRESLCLPLRVSSWDKEQIQSGSEFIDGHLPRGSKGNVLLTTLARIFSKWVTILDFRTPLKFYHDRILIESKNVIHSVCALVHFKTDFHLVWEHVCTHARMARGVGGQLAGVWSLLLLCGACVWIRSSGLVASVLIWWVILWALPPPPPHPEIVKVVYKAEHMKWGIVDVEGWDGSK